MLPLALAVVAWQLFAADRKPSTFLVSYWYVTWDHGFIRRGLLGEVNQFFFGEAVLEGATFLSRVVAGLSVAVLVLVALLLLRRGTPLAVGLGWLLVVSPFTVRGLWNFARPDQLGVPFLLLVALVWWLPVRRKVIPLAVLGLGFAVAVLAHEAIVLMYAPWILVLIVHFSAGARWQVLVARAAAFFAVPAVFTLAVLTRGRATDKQVKLLKADAEPTLPKGNDMLNYIGDTSKDSVAMVLRFGTANMLAMIGMGLALWALHLLILRLVPGTRFVPPRPVAVVLIGAVLPAFGLQSVLAIDWQRWFALWMAMGLLSYGIAVLGSRWGPTSGRDIQPAAEPDRWPRHVLVAFVACCVLLTLIPISTANNKLPCSWDYLVRETPYPFQRVADLATGEDHQYRIIKCKD